MDKSQFSWCYTDYMAVLFKELGEPIVQRTSQPVIYIWKTANGPKSGSWELGEWVKRQPIKGKRQYEYRYDQLYN